MDYSRESWFPWYRRPTPGWLELTASARGVFVSILMELHHETGDLHLARGLHTVSRLIDVPKDVLETAMGELLATGKLHWDEATCTLRDPGFPQRRRNTSTERVRRFRENETLRNVSPVTCNLEEKRRDKKRSVSVSSVTEGNAGIAPPAASPTDALPASKRGTRLPADWTPAPATLAWATAMGIAAPQSALEEFRDYWMGVPGQRGVKLDWDATYRNQLRRVSSRTQAEVAKREEGARPAPYHRMAKRAESAPEPVTAEELMGPLRALGVKT